MNWSLDYLNEPGQPKPGGDAKLPARVPDAAVLTPLTTGLTDYSENPTVRGARPETPGAHGGSAFAGGGLSGRISSPFTPSVQPQDLKDDKLILSAPRLDIDGRKTPLLGGIHILAKIGQGGMGAVYYGVHPRLNQEVAVKILPFHLSERQPELIQRFIREAQIAARVRSPHLVGVIDVNEESGLFYLVMEYVPGKTAGGYLREIGRGGQTGLLEQEALEICIGALEGLAAAHAHGVIHRDIKPDNILIPFATAATSRMRAVGGIMYAEDSISADVPTLKAGMQALAFSDSKLADLGLARNETSDVTMTGVNACMGTPGYMSPEQASDARHASKPADIFSMGATLYALITGDAPFGGTALMHVLNATVKEPHIPIRQRRPDVSTATANLLDRCLAKKPEERFADASVLLSAMHACHKALGKRAILAHDGSPQATMLETGLKTWTQPENFIKNSKSINEPEVVPVPQGKVPEIQKAHGIGMAAALAAMAMVIVAAGGYFGFKIYQDAVNTPDKSGTEKKIAEEKALLESRRALEAAQREARIVENSRLQKETEKSEALRKEAELKMSEAQKATLALEVERKARLEEDERKRKLASDEAARVFESKRKESLAQEALAAAVKAAAEYKSTRNWDGVILALEMPVKLLGNRPHPNRVLAEAMLAEAAGHVERRRLFKAEFERGQAQLKVQNFDTARTAFESAKKHASEPAEKLRIEEGIKNADDGLRQNKIIQAVALERQGRALKPDTNANGDWIKAAESFKNAAEIYQQADRKDDYARNLVLQAECTRKDKNKNGDWAQAAGLYGSAAEIFGALGDKKNQAESLTRQALCSDPANNPAGELRQTAGLYAQASVLHAALGNKKQQADVLSLEGAALFRDKTRVKAFEQATDVFRRSAALYEELGDKKAQGVSLLNQALSMARGQKQGMTPEIKTLLAKAVATCREGGDEATAKIAESWLK